MHCHALCSMRGLDLTHVVIMEMREAAMPCSRMYMKVATTNSACEKKKTDHVKLIARTRIKNKRTDAHARGLTEADLRGLEHRFVGECAGS